MSKLKLEGELSLDGNGWQRTLRQAGDGVDKLAGSSIHHLKSALAGVFALGAMEAFIHKTVEYASQIKDFSEQTGLTTDEVQRLAYAAKSVGLEFGDFQTALSKMGSARKDAAEKNDDLLRTFAAYGVELKDLQNPTLRNIDLLKQMAEAIKGTTLNSGDRQALRELFGKGGDKLAEVIGHLDDFKDRPLINKADIEAIDRLDKAIDRLTTRAKVELAGPIANAARVIDGETPEERRKGLVGLAKTYLGFMLPGAEQIYKSVTTPTGKSGNPTSAVAGAKPALVAEANANTADLFTDQRKIKLAEQQAQLNDLAYKNAFNLMSVDQKRAELVKEINRLLADSNTIRSANPAAAFDLRIEREKKIAELQGLPHPNRPTDSLLQIGGVMGDTAKAIPQIQQKLIDVQQQSIAAMADLTAALKFIGQNIGMAGGANPFASLGIP